MTGQSKKLDPDVAASVRGVSLDDKAIGYLRCLESAALFPQTREVIARAIQLAQAGAAILGMEKGLAVAHRDCGDWITFPFTERHRHLSFNGCIGGRSFASISDHLKTGTRYSLYYSERLLPELPQNEQTPPAPPELKRY